LAAHASKEVRATNRRVDNLSDYLREIETPKDTSVEHWEHGRKEPIQEPGAYTNARLKQRSQTKKQSTQEEQSLLEELFPEIKGKITETLAAEPGPDTAEQHDARKSVKDYPRLELPKPVLFPKSSVGQFRKRPSETERRRAEHLKAMKAEDITVLKLSNVSTELTESDFRRLVPRGKHIENWATDGEFYKVIPARNPISLERLPVYYLLFSSPSAALAYQTNASRLHKLAGLYSPTDVFSAVQPPPGFLEDGEDIAAATQRYILAPPNLRLRLTTELQPYHPWFRGLLERGGYRGVVLPDKEDTPKVLLHIEGYEPEQQELNDLLYRDGYERGFPWPIRDGPAGILKLRDVINYRPKLGLKNNMDSLNEAFDTPLRLDDGSLVSSDEPYMRQQIMSKMYNRWIIQFDDVDMARRFASTYHRRVLPKPLHLSWKVFEVERYCNTELLW
jgi:hypothetical protein